MIKTKFITNPDKYSINKIGSVPSKTSSKTSSKTFLVKPQKRMLKGGISALPYIIDKIETGDEELINSVKKLTNGSGNSLDKDAGREDCLNWWKENKDKWSMVQK